MPSVVQFILLNCKLFGIEESPLPEPSKEDFSPMKYGIRPISFRLSREIEDRILIHAKKHKHTLTTMIQILMEEGLDARDLLEKVE
jgi:hypothetical protein